MRVLLTSLLLSTGLWGWSSPLHSAEHGVEESGRPVGWRGDATGSFDVEDAPTTWSSDAAIVWSTKMTGFTNASPLVIGDRVFTCEELATLTCVSREGGRIMWRRSHTYVDLLPLARQAEARTQAAAALEARERLQAVESRMKRLDRGLSRKPDNPELKAEKEALQREAEELRKVLDAGGTYLLPPTDPANGYTSSTPVSDGRRIYALFGTGIAAVYRLDGTLIWRRLIQRPEEAFGHSASPVLVGGTLIVHIKDLFGLDAATGAVKWRIETPHFWGTPVHTRIGDTDVVVTPAGAIVRVRDGHVMASDLARLEFASPLVVDGVVYFIESRASAYRLPTREAESYELEPLWKARLRGPAHYASPVLHDGLLYTVSDREAFSVVDAKTGETVYEERLSQRGEESKTLYPSVCYADGKVYVFRSNGITNVVKPGREYEELARNTLEPIRSTPVFADDGLYLRGLDHLYRIGNAKQAAK